MVQKSVSEKWQQKDLILLSVLEKLKKMNGLEKKREMGKSAWKGKNGDERGQ